MPKVSAMSVGFLNLYKETGHYFGTLLMDKFLAPLHGMHTSGQHHQFSRYMAQLWTTYLNQLPPYFKLVKLYVSSKLAV